MANLQTISPTRAAELVRKGAVLIDIRGPDEYAREHVPGARHHALSRIDAESPIRNGDEVLIFHCRSGARTQGNAARLSAASPELRNLRSRRWPRCLEEGRPAGDPRSQPTNRHYAAGADCRWQFGAAGRHPRYASCARFLCSIGIGGRGLDVCRHDRLLRYGPASSLHALEPAHVNCDAMTLLHDLLAVASGGAVGFVLGLVGGGGSILAVPLLVYVVGVPSPHVAIGTSAIAVAASAAANLVGHARARTVKWRCALTFAISGMIGAAGGAQLGKMVDGTHLLMLFGILMVVVGLMMLRPRKSGDNPDVKLTFESMPHMLPLLIGIGLAVGALSGFFGIGGGFLIVPGLIGATAMPLINAIGSSLVSVTALGLTTAASYAWSGLVDWPLAGLFIAGGILGGLLGIRLAGHLATYKHALTRIFSGTVITVGIYVVIRSLVAS